MEEQQEQEQQHDEAAAAVETEAEVEAPVDEAPARIKAEVEAPVAVDKETPALLTAAQILAADDLSFVDVPVPEWGGTIRLREMSAGEAIKFTDSLQDNAKSRNQAIVRIIRDTAVGVDGARLFPGDGDMEKLRAKSFKVFQVLSDAALKLNGFRDEDDEEESEKND